jgi:hypothetical protein
MAEEKNELLVKLCSYLLFERKQETQLSMAYSIFAQERHNAFHTNGNPNSGDGTNFCDCTHEKCQMAFNVIKDSREMAIEFNEFSIKAIEGFRLKVDRQGRSVKAFLDIPQPKEIKENK